MGSRALGVVFVLVGVFIAGCLMIPDSTSRPAPLPESQNRAAAQGNLAKSILLRVDALRKAADAAVKLDGTQKTAQVRQSLGNCMNAKDPCLKIMHDAEQDSKVGAWSGFAIYVTNPLVRYMGFTMVRPPGSPPWTLPPDVGPILAAEENVQLAEGLVKQAMEEAQKISDARNAQGAKINEEASAVAVAQAACAKDEPGCKGRCDREPMYCMAWAGRLWDLKPPRLLDVKIYIQKACDGGVATACSIIDQVDQQIEQAAGRINQLWNGVTQAGDELAQRNFTVENRVKMGSLSDRELRRVLTVNEAVVTEKFCPARKLFLQASTPAEFQKRATVHCKNEAPTGQGISGAEVPLTTLCAQAYATSCP